MTANMEKIADKIQKLLALAGNNPSEEEAKAALLKAQKMMAEYNLSQSDLSGEEKINYSLEPCKVRVNPRSKTMCTIIANSFACKAIIVGSKINFFGREDNAKAAKSSMEFIHKAMEHGMSEECRKYGLSTSQSGASLIYNAYAKGYINGLKQALDAQCVALAVIVPQDVKEEFSKKFPNLRKTSSRMTSGRQYSESYFKGEQDGRSVMNKRSLEAGV